MLSLGPCLTFQGWWCFWRCSACRPRNAVIVANQNPKESLKAKVQAGKRMCWTTWEVTQMLWFREWWDLIAFYCTWWRRHLTYLFLTYRIDVFQVKKHQQWAPQSPERKDVHCVTMRAFNKDVNMWCISWYLNTFDSWFRIDNTFDILLIWKGVFVEEWQRLNENRCVWTFGLRGTSMAWSHRRGGEMECDRRYIEA